MVARGVTWPGGHFPRNLRGGDCIVGHFGACCGIILYIFYTNKVRTVVCKCVNVRELIQSYWIASNILVF